MNPQAPLAAEPETTGRYIVTFRDGAHAEALAALANGAGLDKSKMITSSDFGTDGIDLAQLASDGGAVFEHLGVAVVNVDPRTVGTMSMAAGTNSAILAIEPEGVMHAVDDLAGLSLDYLRGFRDAAAKLLDTAENGGPRDDEADVEATFVDTATLTWGLQATKAGVSTFSGQGIKVAILDTGFFLAHPDFVGRPIVGKSFIPGVTSVNDGHGHGTHCTGTSCGPFKPPIGPRYGIAHKAQIHIGKVLSDQGSGNDASILAGIDWAVANKCAVISMSLGAEVASTSVAYETAGQRALNAGCLIVAAAGNNAHRSSAAFGFVIRPANSRSVMAVGALQNTLGIADFSSRDTAHAAGTAVDIAGPGVGVLSSWPMPTRYRSISGTSMATPHVAGIAALLAEKTGLRGAALWQQVIVNARALTLPIGDVGRGLVQAP